MDVCKCIVSLRHGGTLNSRRAVKSSLEVGGRGREVGDHWPSPGCSLSKLAWNYHLHGVQSYGSCQVIYSQFGLAIHQKDHQARRRFVEWAQNEIAVVPDFHKRILFSDEAHFWLNGYVNKQNCRIWSEANP
ncbi:hypothetical protein TNCV_389131 [Trichonephila clavipes]|nr:hypothetical protein TNCV_389131 [Trichonephila clavipes]